MSAPWDLVRGVFVSRASRITELEAQVSELQQALADVRETVETLKAKDTMRRLQSDEHLSFDKKLSPADMVDVFLNGVKQKQGT